ncbi:MAG: hypothetical protein L0212_00730 [Acidobacteria bacterium]|nr:hypothetical protein [Acidobacteriota bacterium]
MLPEEIVELEQEATRRKIPEGDCRLLLGFILGRMRSEGASVEDLMWYIGASLELMQRMQQSGFSGGAALFPGSAGEE